MKNFYQSSIANKLFADAYLYEEKLKKVIFQNVENDKLMNNLLIKLKINEFSDRFIFVEIYSPRNNKRFKKIGIDCDSNFRKVKFTDSSRRPFCSSFYYDKKKFRQMKHPNIFIPSRKTNFNKHYDKTLSFYLKHEIVHALQVMHKYVSNINYKHVKEYYRSINSDISQEYYYLCEREFYPNLIELDSLIKKSIFEKDDDIDRLFKYPFYYDSLEDYYTNIYPFLKWLHFLKKNQKGFEFAKKYALKKLKTI